LFVVWIQPDWMLGVPYWRLSTEVGLIVLQLNAKTKTVTRAWRCISSQQAHNVVLSNFIDLSNAYWLYCQCTQH